MSGSQGTVKVKMSQKEGGYKSGFKHRIGTILIPKNRLMKHANPYFDGLNNSHPWVEGGITVWLALMYFE